MLVRQTLALVLAVMVLTWLVDVFTVVAAFAILKAIGFDINIT